MRRLLRFWDVGKRLWELAALILAVQDPRVDGRARAIVALVIVYALLPVDIVPEFIPFAGVIDDLLLGWLGLSRAAALVPPEVMQEHRQAIGTALSRYAARPLGTYEENGHVFSSQLAFYNFLITGRW